MKISYSILLHYSISIYKILILIYLYIYICKTLLILKTKIFKWYIYIYIRIKVFFLYLTPFWENFLAYLILIKDYYNTYCVCKRISPRIRYIPSWKRQIQISDIFNLNLSRQPRTSDINDIRMKLIHRTHLCCTPN